MISKRWSKLIKSLQVKKYRKEHKAFLVEGAKSLLEVLNSDLIIQQLFCTHSFFEEYKQLIVSKVSYEIVTSGELEKNGTFSSNNGGLAVVSIPDTHNIFIEDNYTLVLDNVNDPGNLGTIIRIADWYGIQQIICSPTTADVYNPKVITASMGSFTRVNVFYKNLLDLFDQNPEIPVYGAFLEGEDVHQESFAPSGFLVMGNEANGISQEVEEKVSNKISIPSYGEAESLNVAIATAVILDNIRR